MGRIGTGVYETANDTYNMRVIGLDNDKTVIQQHVLVGRNVLFGDVTDIDFWNKIAADQVNYISLCMPVHTANVIAVEQLKQAGYVGFLSATARYEDEAVELHEMGVQSVYNVFQNVGPAYARYAIEDYKKIYGQLPEEIDKSIINSEQ